MCELWLGRRALTLANTCVSEGRVTLTREVGPPSLEAIFRVNTLMGPRHCHVDGGELDCRLDARESRGFPAEYVWTFIRDNQTATFTARTPVVNPPIGCNFLADGGLVRDSGLPHHLCQVNPYKKDRRRTAHARM